MNVLHVVNVFFTVPFFLGGQFEYFKRKGYNIHLVCSPSECINSYADQHEFEYLETPISRRVAIVSDIKSIFRICRYIRSNKIDIVVGHTPKGALLAMIAAWLCRVPKRLYYRHGLVYETSYGLKRRILIFLDKVTSYCATKIVCVSKSVLSRSIEDGLASPKKQVILGNGTCNGIDAEGLYNPQNISYDDTQRLRMLYNIKEGDFIIGYSGRLVKDKGIVELVKAFSLFAEHDNCKLLLVGMFEERDALPNEVKEYILRNEKIIYTGYISKGMENYYALMDVYVLPSYREGFPTGVLEAQSMGIPVLTTRVTGCCDSIVDGETGLFISHDPVDIKEKIDEIRIKHYISGDIGRRWVINNFNCYVVWEAIEKLYQS